MDYYKYKLLRVSSEDKIAASQSNTDFSIDISKITHPAKDKCIGVSLIECAFENFIYNVRAGINDTLSIQENGQARQNITIPEGYYNFNDIVTKLTADINTALTGGTVAITDNTYNKKFVFTFTGTTCKVIVDNISNLSNTLGFTTTTPTFAAVITADKLFRLSGAQQAYLECKQFGRGHLFDSKNNNRRDVLNVIPINSAFGTTVFYSNPNHNDRITWTPPRQFNTLDFRLTNGDGQPFDIQLSHLKLIIALLY